MYTVPQDERITVQRGDVIGVLYANNSDADASGIFTFSSSAADTVCCGQASEDLRVVHRLTDTFADDLMTGSVVGSLDLTERVSMPFAALLSDGEFNAMRGFV